MDDLGLVKVFVMSMATLGLVRLFVSVFLGESENGPAIGRWIQRFK